MASSLTDRRVVSIGILTMVVFLLVGIGSAVVFARPSCRLVAPTVSTERVAYDSATAADLQLEPALVAFAGVLQSFGTVQILPGEGVSELVSFGESVAAVGSELLAFDDTLQPYATVTFRDGIVVGSGSGLYALVVTNDLTGQIDALQPIDDTLTAQTCVELALVSTPLAFFRDAADGEILLLRADEDGEDPFIELRDPLVGRRLELPVTLTVGSAGQHGARTSGVLLPGMVAFSQNVSDTNQDEPVLWVFDRDTGAPTFTRTASEIRQVSGREGAFTLQLARHRDGLVLTVNDTDWFDVASDTGVLIPRSEPPADVPQMYAAELQAFATDFASWSHVAHPAGDVFLVDTGTQRAMFSVKRQG